MKNPLQTLKIITLTLAFSLGLSYVYAWTAPSSLPPGGNTSAPLNTSGIGQIKNGGLLVGNTLAATANALLIPNGNVGIGTTTPQVKLDVVGSINTTGDVCASGKCLRNPTIQTIYVFVNGTTYSSSHVGMVEVEFHGGAIQGGLGNLGWNFYVNGIIVSAWSALVNYQVAVTPSYTYFFQSTGTFTVREDWIPGMIFGQIVIKKY